MALLIFLATPQRFCTRQLPRCIRPRTAASRMHQCCMPHWLCLTKDATSMPRALAGYLQPVRSARAHGARAHLGHPPQRPPQTDQEQGPGRGGDVPGPHRHRHLQQDAPPPLGARVLAAVQPSLVVAGPALAHSMRSCMLPARCSGRALANCRCLSRQHVRPIRRLACWLALVLTAARARFAPRRTACR